LEAVAAISLFQIDYPLTNEALIQFTRQLHHIKKEKPKYFFSRHLTMIMDYFIVIIIGKIH